MGFSKTIQMYIFDGNPNGRIMCELSNWNGRVYKVSRTELSLFSKREDAGNTGVYFLFGKDDSNSDTVYIGEAENIINRLKQHLSTNQYWNDCIVVVSKDNLLNKAHVKYLEHKFYALAKDADRSIVVNSNIPTCSSISEYDEAMLEEFISNTRLLVNTLGYKTFDTLEESLPSKKEAKVFFYIKAARGADAKGIIVADGFAVLRGSVISSTTVPSMTDSLVALRKKLIQKRVIDESFRFVKDYVFTSPSTAAAVVMGRNENGRMEWKTENSKTLSMIEQES